MLSTQNQQKAGLIYVLYKKGEQRKSDKKMTVFKLYRTTRIDTDWHGKTTFEKLLQNKNGFW